MKSATKTELVLVGGGHSHVQVLEGLAMEPLPDTRITLVVDRPVATYSGMVPGFVAGQYRQRELEIDVLPLARAVGARVIVAQALRIEADSNRIQIEGRPPIPFDWASINIGSTVAGLSTPGVREYAIPTRPIGLFVSRLDSVLADLGRNDSAGAVRVTVVGAGVGGVEVAFALDHRLRELGHDTEITLVESGDRILPGYSKGMLSKALGAAESSGIRILTSHRVTRVEPQAAFLESHRDGETTCPFDLLLWVTGAVSHPLFRESNLPTDERGFVKVRSTLQLEGHDHIFAVGDCSTLTRYPETPKAGVYAVRQGPILTANLRRVLEGTTRLEQYKPQHDFLTLINTGGGRAIGGKWFLSAEGSWVFKLKDHIDRKFMYRFQPLDHPDRKTAFEAGIMSQEAGEVGEAEMLCGGCAAKLGQVALERTLSRLPSPPEDNAVELGPADGDDVASYTSPRGERIVASLDQFRAFTDDPYLVGKIGAINAASDLLAKGVRPRFAHALVTLPESESQTAQEEALFQVMSGAREALDPLGASVVGGHTTTGPELVAGFHLEGFVSADFELLAHQRLEAGQALLLSKGLGTGVLFRADMLGRLRGPWFTQAIESMLLSNQEAIEVARRFGARAATDVTGFGLAGHLASMLRTAGLSAEVSVAELPALAGAVELFETGLRSTFHEENAKMARGMEIERAARDEARFPLLFDPQTSGGLLFGVPPENAEAALAELLASGHRAAIIGATSEPGPGSRLRIRSRQRA